MVRSRESHRASFSSIVKFPRPSQVRRPAGVALGSLVEDDAMRFLFDVEEDVCWSWSWSSWSWSITESVSGFPSWSIASSSSSSSFLIDVLFLISFAESVLEREWILD